MNLFNIKLTTLIYLEQLLKFNNIKIIFALKIYFYASNILFYTIFFFLILETAKYLWIT